MILASIQTKKEFMSRIEKKIAEVILENPEKFINYSAVELSELAGVSQGSINNFSKKYAGGGFSELKVKIATEIGSYRENYFDKVSDEDTISEVMRISAKNIYTAFSETQQVNREETLKAAAKIIMNAKKIEVYGMAQSGVVAHDFAYQLLRLGYTVKSVNEALVCAASAMTLDEESVVIAVSTMGKTLEIYDGVKLAKENGAKCICITQNDQSPVAKLCDVVLVVSGGDKRLEKFVGTAKLCEYFLIDSICSYIRHMMTEEEKAKYAKVLEILNSHTVEG